MISLMDRAISLLPCSDMDVFGKIYPEDIEGYILKNQPTYKDGIETPRLL